MPCVVILTFNQLSWRLNKYTQTHFAIWLCLKTNAHYAQQSFHTRAHLERRSEIHKNSEWSCHRIVCISPFECRCLEHLRVCMHTWSDNFYCIRSGLLNWCIETFCVGATHLCVCDNQGCQIWNKLIWNQQINMQFIRFEDILQTKSN